MGGRRKGKGTKTVEEGGRKRKHPFLGIQWRVAPSGTKCIHEE